MQCSVSFAETHGGASCLIPAASLISSEGVLLNFLLALYFSGAALNFSSIRHSPKEFLFPRQEWGEEVHTWGQVLLFLDCAHSVFWRPLWFGISALNLTQ